VDRYRMPRPGAKRGRGLFTGLMAFGVALLIGRVAVSLIAGPPTSLVVLIFVGAYVGAYVLFWRTSESFFDR
jgi:hypothetical protein